MQRCQLYYKVNVTESIFLKKCVMRTQAHSKVVSNKYVIRNVLTGSETGGTSDIKTEVDIGICIYI